MELKPNEPRLADVRAPWSLERRRWGAFKPWNLRETFAYIWKYRMFSAPSSMDRWKYRELLKDLDSVCLPSLKSHGALTAKELADSLNREGVLRTKPRRTGIHRISVATAHDWINLACRRGYVVAWHGNSGQGDGTHWELTEGGQEAIRWRFVTLISRLPYASMVPLLVTGGGLVAALNWLARHPTAIVVAFYALLLVLYVGALAFWFGRSERRENPGFAVVAIETLRSAKKPIPRL